MGKEVKEVTPEELAALIKSQEGEFVIRVEFGEEAADGEDGNTGNISA